MNFYKKSFILGLSVLMTCGQCFSTKAVKTNTWTTFEGLKKIEEIECKNIRSKKVVMIGDRSSGKTSVYNRLTDCNFNGDQRVSIAAEVKEFCQDDFEVLLWDTPGHKNFKTLWPIYVHDASLIVLTYDLSADESKFDSILKWLTFIKERSFSAASVVLVGTKSDLQCNENLENLVKEKCEQENIEYFGKVSAKTDEGINELKQKILEKNLFKIKNKVLSRTKCDE